MHTYFLPGAYRYLSTHSELAITMTSGSAAVVLLIVLIAGSEFFRLHLGERTVEYRIARRRVLIAVVPLSFVAAVTVIERFRLLAA